MALVLLAVSCKKENNLENAKSTSAGNLALVSPAGVTVYGDMLHFPDVATLLTTLDDLENEVEVYDDNFLASHSELTQEELFELEDSVNYDENKPLEDFENQYPGFHSLRKMLSDEFNAWLDTDGDNVANDPDHHFILDDNFRAVLNEQACLRVEDTIYLMHDTGWIEVYNADLDVVADIEAGIIDANAEPTPQTLGIFRNLGHSQANCDDAITSRAQDGYKLGANDRRIKWKLVAENVAWWHKVKGKVWGYKKNKRGKWKKYRSGLWVRVEGIVYDQASCTPFPFDMATGAYYSVIVTQHERKLKQPVPFGGPFCFKKGEIIGRFYGADGASTAETLTW